MHNFYVAMEATPTDTQQRRSIILLGPIGTRPHQCVAPGICRIGEGCLFLHGGVAEARIRYMPPRNVRQVSLIPDIGFATYASPIDNSIIRRHAVMTFASGYMKLQINFSCENFHEDTTSDHTDGNGATI
jgi:hypothetical protein